MLCAESTWQRPSESSSVAGLPTGDQSTHSVAFPPHSIGTPEHSVVIPDGSRPHKTDLRNTLPEVSVDVQRGTGVHALVPDERKQRSVKVRPATLSSGRVGPRLGGEWRRAQGSGLCVPHRQRHMQAKQAPRGAAHMECTYLTTAARFRCFLSVLIEGACGRGGAMGHRIACMGRRCGAGGGPGPPHQA